jgi:hypothetical protein
MNIFRDVSLLEHPSSWFLKLFQAITIVVHRNVLRSMALVLGANILLTMAKDTGGFSPIAISKVFFQLI